MTAMPRRRHAPLRSAAFALVASGMCNACSEPTPPAAPADATETPTKTAATSPETTTPPAATSSPEAVAESPAAQTSPPMPTPPKPVATPAPPAPAPSPPATDAQPVQIVVTMLSRGKGVRTQARDAYKQIHYLLEQQQAQANVTNMQTSRIGLEGETRLCAEFRNRDDAQAALAEIRKLSDGVDLLNVVEEPCPSSKVDKP